MDAETRARRTLPADAADLLDVGLPASDLRTVLLGVARARASAVTPAEVLRRWTQDRFVRPAPSDPRAVAAVERVPPVGPERIEKSTTRRHDDAGGDVSMRSGPVGDAQLRRCLATPRHVAGVSQGNDELLVRAPARL